MKNERIYNYHYQERNYNKIFIPFSKQDNNNPHSLGFIRLCQDIKNKKKITQMNNSNNNNYYDYCFSCDRYFENKKLKK